ncbi:regulator of hemoglobinization and erythroid cell expansion protein [Lontra canadensis]|uniref:regulator of hemoglobinization and erythroid cell expansion protein n=1 Tax=Lontra canadensis TaxID=76717 RepID=UPI0013F30F4E|nr:regulator of hemoglobinization and erythroid cell expansion protein [Lontra canadensis]
MLTEDMKLWHGLVIAAVSLILQACLFAAFGYLLSRHMAKESERLLKGARLQAPNPSPAHHQPLPAKEETPSTSVSEPRYRRERHGSGTSSGSSDSVDSSGSLSPACQAMKNMNYAQVVFSATKELKNESSLDYENIKETTDYVNVNPKSHKPNFWTFAKPADSEPVEYTQVAPL